MKGIDRLPPTAQKIPDETPILTTPTGCWREFFTLLNRPNLLLRTCFKQRIDVDSKYLVQKGAEVQLGDSSPGFPMVDRDVTDTH